MKRLLATICLLTLTGCAAERPVFCLLFIEEIFSSSPAIKLMMAL